MMEKNTPNCAEEGGREYIVVHARKIDPAEMESQLAKFDPKPFEEVAKANGITRLRSFTLPLVDGTSKRVSRTLDTVYECVENDPTLVMYTDDPASCLYLEKHAGTAVDAPFSPEAVARMSARNPSLFDRSSVMFVYGADGTAQQVRLGKTDPEGPTFFGEVLKSRGRHGDQCVVCYEMPDVVACCKRCSATMCMPCNRKNQVHNGARCPLCRDEAVHINPPNSQRQEDSRIVVIVA